MPALQHRAHQNQQASLDGGGHDHSLARNLVTPATASTGVATAPADQSNPPLENPFWCSGPGGADLERRKRPGLPHRPA